MYHIGNGEAEQHAHARRGAGIDERMDDRLAGDRVLEQQIVQIGQGEILQRKAASPGAAETGLADHEKRQIDRQRSDQQRIEQRHKAPAPETHQPQSTTLAGERYLAAPLQHGTLDRKVEPINRQDRTEGAGDPSSTSRGVAIKLKSAEAAIHDNGPRCSRQDFHG